MISFKVSGWVEEDQCLSDLITTVEEKNIRNCSYSYSPEIQVGCMPSYKYSSYENNRPQIK
jgi:hypothetical protein